MSGQFSSALMFISIVAIALAANRAEENATSSARRDPASQAELNKEEILGTFKPETALLHTEKLRGPLSIRLSSDLSAAKGQIFVLRGTISSRKTLQDGVDFTWSLPDGVELVAGQLTGHLNGLTSDQPLVLELTLRKVLDQNLQIHLLASASNGSMRFAESAQYNTDSVSANDQKLISGTPGDLKVFH